MYKICTKCKTEKPINQFRLNKEKKDGHYSSCKECDKLYRLLNKNKISLQHKRHYQKNKIRLQIYQKEYLKDNREKVNARCRLRKQSDINYKLSCLLRTRQNDALKGRVKSGSSILDLGCSVEFLKQYLESKFTSKMTWENHGSYWHIDHIIPLSKFDLTDREQFLKACHYTNLQPLEAVENIRKGNKVI